jgi:hypothetical protein
MRQKGGGGDNDTLSPDFLDFIMSLNQHNVDCVLVGGYALGVHGVVRATGDIDFLYRATKKNVRRLCNAMIHFGAPPEIIDEETLLQPGIVTQFGQPPYRIDLLNAIDGVSFAEVWQGAEVTNLEGQEVRVIGLEELKANKSATGRKKDKEDVRRLNSKWG